MNPFDVAATMAQVVPVIALALGFELRALTGRIREEPPVSSARMAGFTAALAIAGLAMILLLIIEIRSMQVIINGVTVSMTIQLWTAWTVPLRPLLYSAVTAVFMLPVTTYFLAVFSAAGRTARVALLLLAGSGLLTFGLSVWRLL